MKIWLFCYWKKFPKVLDKSPPICYNIIVPRGTQKTKERYIQMTKKLKFMPYAQAQVIISDEGDTIQLKSYETIVATISLGSWLTINGLYSMTTRKHIKAFCKEYCGFSDFSLIKHLATNNVCYDFTTGEVVMMLENEI
jgi:hypothetical protein